MSDAAPAVEAAPVEAETPTEATAAPKVGETTATPKPRTIDDDLEDVLKKHGGYAYKAGGKEKKVTAAADLKRMLSRVDGTEAAASDLAKRSQKVDAIEKVAASLEKLPPKERMRQLESLGFSKKAIREAMEEEILEEDTKEKQRSHLSARERELEDAIEKQAADLAKYRQQEEKTKAEQEEQAYVARVQEVGQRLEKVTVGALQKAKITPSEAPQYIQAIADRLNRNERLGLGLDEEELADVVVQERESNGKGWLKGKDAPSMADMLDEMGLSKPLMLEFARRIKEKQNGPTPVNVTQLPRNGASSSTPVPEGESVAEKLSFWRSR